MRTRLSLSVVVAAALVACSNSSLSGSSGKNSGSGSKKDVTSSENEDGGTGTGTGTPTDTGTGSTKDNGSSTSTGSSGVSASSGGETARIAIDGTATIAPKGVDAGDAKDLVWSSSDPSVVSVDPKTGAIKGLKPGSAVITGKTPKGIEITVTVSVVTPEEIEVTSDASNDDPSCKKPTPPDGELYVIAGDTKLWIQPYDWRKCRTNLDADRLLQDADAKDVQISPENRIFVLGNNKNLWIEPRGWLTNFPGKDSGRDLQDENTTSFRHGPAGFVMVLGYNGDLWAEPHYWRRDYQATDETGRDRQDTTVAAWASQPNYGGIIVSGGGNLWSEPTSWLKNNRTTQTGRDNLNLSGVIAVELSTDGKHYFSLLGDGSLKFSQGLTHANQSRDVQAFFVGPDAVLTIDNDDTLWVEPYNWLQDHPKGDSGRKKQDVNVVKADFAANGDVIVLTKDNKLWREPVGWFENDAVEADRVIQDEAVTGFYVPH